MEEQTQNKMGTMPIGRLLAVMSVPMMISMFVQALYNMVDSMFVAMISENALTAVSLAFPMQTIMNAVAVGTGVGINAMVSRSLGGGDLKSAGKAASVQIFLSAAYSAAAVIIGLALSHTFYTNQTDVAEIVEYGESYMRIVCVFSFGMFYGQNFEKLLVATGSSALSMISQVLGAVINIILDPILIFGLGPFPELGVEGAAIATVIGQSASAAAALIFNLKFNKAARFSLRGILPDAKTLRGIFSVGVPSMITIGLASVLSYCMNQLLLGFSTTAAAVYGIWIKVQNFGFMPVFGMNNGTIAIYSYNYGAKKYDRVRKTLRLAITIGLAVTIAAAVLYELIPTTLLRLFNASDYMHSIGVRALRLCSLSLPFGALSIILCSPFQSLGKPNYALAVNICRQVVIQVPCAWLLSLTGALDAVWLAALVAEAATAVIALVLTGRVMRRLNG